MDFDTQEWLGSWENFELYFTDTNPLMCRAWEEAERAVKAQKKNLLSAFLFRKGAKQFWISGCYTVTKENPMQLGGWNVRQGDGGALHIEWLAANGESLGEYSYVLDSIVERGLEGKTNYLLRTDAADAGAFRYILSMAPMPERAAKDSGGLISHLHFQYASKKELLLAADGKLKKPHWYATMCDREASMLQRCNIVRALHKLPLWNESDV